MSQSKMLYVVGQTRVEAAWEVQGIFDDEERAVACCRDENFFVMAVPSNRALPEESVPAPTYWPIQGVKMNGYPLAADRATPSTHTPGS